MNQGNGRYRVRIATPALVVAVLLLMEVIASAQSSSTPQLQDSVSSLTYFLGDWECAGKFDSSGKTIEAHQRFASELDGAWVTFRHDDQPPFGYHSLAEWGWDAKQKQFVMTVQDSSGGLRLFHSGGWNSKTLQWDGGAIGASSDPDQRFGFDRVDDRHFVVSYFTLKNGSWFRVDSSTCSKQ
jgi:hypothetical protein